jgi:paraquat-inducible protein B
VSEQTEAARALPTATIRSRRSVSPIWIVPLLSVALAGWLGWRAWSMRGVSIAVQLPDGHGLKPGDEVRYRGIAVGRIDNITVGPDLGAVIVKARLTTQADQLARAGTRFWVVRPHLQLMEIRGLETLMGPRFLAASPATSINGDQSPRQREFVGLPEPPVLQSTSPDDLEVILQAQARGSLHPGAPVSYRQTRVGTVLSVGLAGDASAVEARINIQQPFVQLIRPNTRFWDAGGLEAHVGLTGVTITVESAEALLTGGVALATPPPGEAGGDVVRTGHRFLLADEPDTDWLAWEPMVAIGSSLLPVNVSPPSPLRATIGWKQGRIIRSTKHRQGWVLLTDGGLLGPADLLKPIEDAQPESVVLEVSGTVVPLTAPPAWERNGLAMLGADTPGAGAGAGPRWPQDRLRVAAEPEECLVISDPAAAPLPLAASRLSVDRNSAVSFWRIDEAIPIDPTWHGACVIARSDGALVGLLLVDDRGRARVALLTP